jgi:hypothetical protein
MAHGGGKGENGALGEDEMVQGGPGGLCLRRL